jgi:hypothetical protein
MGPWEAAGVCWALGLVILLPGLHGTLHAQVLTNPFQLPGTHCNNWAS